MRDQPGPAVVTGAGGFVGRSLCARLQAPATVHLGGDDWRARTASARLAGATVFHLAARVHRAGDRDEAGYQHDNVEKTRVLAEAAAAQGASRFVFLSSIKVNAEETAARAVAPGDAPAPADAYARSKWAAEQALAAIAASTGLAVVVVRAPLVVGPGAGGNLRTLLRLADSPWPLPFAAIDNHRTMIDVDDLADLLVRCAISAHAPGRTWLAGDPDAVSTPRLVAGMRRALGRPPRLFSVPPRALETGAAIAGRRETVRRLTRSLEVDASATQRELEWRPAIGLEAGIARMAASFRAAPR